MLVSSAVDHGFELRLIQILDYKIGICCFTSKHTVLERKIKDWLARNLPGLTTHSKNRAT